MAMAQEDLNAGSLLEFHGATKQCFICFLDQSRSIFVRFKPCTHEVCSSCMQDLRKEAIRKPKRDLVRSPVELHHSTEIHYHALDLAAKGVKCPYCRTFVDRYEAIDRSHLETVAACESASLVAARASRARLGIVEKPHEPVNVHGGWRCTFCEHLSCQATEMCAACGKPRLDITPKLPPDSKSIADMTTAEVRHCAMIKCFPQLMHAFTGMHVAFSEGRISQSSAELCAALAEALPLAPFACKQLSYHFYGNYFMQTLLSVAWHARAVTPRISSSATPEILNCASKTFGNILSALQGDLVDMALHPQANYVIDTLLELSSEEEVAVVAEEMSSSFFQLVSHRWGHKLLVQAVNKMKKVLCDPSNPCGPTMHTAVNRVCMRVAASVYAMRDTPVCHHVNAVHTLKMLIELACPLQGCLALAEGLMNVLPHLVIDEGGHNVRDSGLQCIQVLVDLQPVTHLGVAPLFRDMVCLLALRLQGHFGGLVQHSAAAVAALSSILDRLHRDQELDWLDVIIQELLQELCASNQLLHMEDLLDVLTRTLASPLLHDHYVSELLDMMAAMYPTEHGMLRSRVAAARRPGQVRPEELYYRHSVLQPELLECMRSGTWEPPPPPPLGMANHRRDSVSSALYSPDMHASHASSAISPSPRRRSSNVLSSASLDPSLRGRSPSVGGGPLHGGLGPPMHVHAPHARSSHGLGDAEVLAHAPNAWGESSSYACTQTMQAWEPHSTNQQVNQVQQSQQIDMEEWPALGAAKPCDGGAQDSAARASTGAVSAGAVSPADANHVAGVPVGSVHTAATSQDNMHAHAHREHSGVSGASEQSSRAYDAWGKSMQAGPPPIGGGAQASTAAHAMLGGGDQAVIGDKMHGVLGGGDVSFSGALPGDLLEDSDLHGAHWDAAGSAAVPLGGTAHASIASTDWNVEDAQSAQRSEHDMHTTSSLPSMPMAPPLRDPPPSGLRASTGAASAPNLPFPDPPGGVAGTHSMPSMHSALDALTSDLSELGFSSGAGGKAPPQPHNAPPPPPPPPPAGVLGGSFGSSSGVGGAMHQGNIWGPPNPSGTLDSSANAFSPQGSLLPPNSHPDFPPPMPPSGPQSPSVAGKERARTFENPTDTFSRYSSGQFSVDVAMPPPQPPSDAPPTQPAPRYPQNPPPPVWGPPGSYNPPPLSPRFQPPPGTSPPQWGPQPPGSMGWMPPGQMHYRPGPHSMHSHPGFHGPMGPLQAPFVPPSMQQSRAPMPPQYPPQSAPMHAQLSSDAPRPPTSVMNHSNMQMSSELRQSSWPQADKPPDDPTNSHHSFHSYPHMHAQHASTHSHEGIQHQVDGPPLVPEKPPLTGPSPGMGGGIWGPPAAIDRTSSQTLPSPSGMSHASTNAPFTDHSPSSEPPPGLGRSPQPLSGPPPASRAPWLMHARQNSDVHPSPPPPPAPSRPPVPPSHASPQRAGGDTPWACKVCTYNHTGPEALFLACAMCGSPRLGQE